MTDIGVWKFAKGDERKSMDELGRAINDCKAVLETTDKHIEGLSAFRKHLDRKIHDAQITYHRVSNRLSEAVRERKAKYYEAETRSTDA